MKIEDICIWYETAKTQRIREVEQGKGLMGTLGFEKKGCYECDGHNKNCRDYIPQTKQTKKYLYIKSSQK